MTARVGLIWAEASGGVIGAAGGMPWHVPEDLAHFKEVTDGHPVVMGRLTWESLPPRFRPLPGRRNIVVTRRPDWSDEGAQRAGSLEEALVAARAGEAEWVWVIGGGEVFREAMGCADRLEITELDLQVTGDTWAPDRSGWQPEPGTDAAWRTSAGGLRYRFLTLVRTAGDFDSRR